MQVRTRFPPSPTGELHIGGVRTALFNWLYARKHGGVFILRLEDTDRERSTEAYTEAIIEGMHWLGLDYDEGPYYQSRRVDRYREVIEKLLAAGHAYRCYCTKEELEAMRAEAMARKEKPRYDGRCRHRTSPPPGIEPVVRLKNPQDGEVIVDDQVHGQVRFDNRELDDLIIARADGMPTYHLSVCVDDMDMKVTHVIRGDDHLNNTPRQINILRALGATLPVYAHLPMILGPDGKRLSKRHAAASVQQYRDAGYLPEALLNYLARLGWAHGDQEVFSVDELISNFDIPKINKAAASFDPAKLDWLNQHYLKTLPAQSVAARLHTHLRHRGIDPDAGPPLPEVVLALRERAKTLEDMAESARCFFQEPKDFEDQAARKNLTGEAVSALELTKRTLGALQRWDDASLHKAVSGVAEQLGIKLGKVAQPLRVAVTGSAASPPIDVTLRLVGRDRALSRIQRALDYIGAR
jgi:glutamyl-tRNA synthetase